MLSTVIRVALLAILATGVAADINATLPVTAAWRAVCSNVVTHTCIKVDARLASITCVQQHDTLMGAYASFASILSVPCRSAFMRYACAYWAPPCDAEAKFPPESIALKLADQAICPNVTDGQWLGFFRAASASPTLPFGASFAAGFPSDATNTAITFKINDTAASSTIPVPSCVPTPFPSATSMCAPYVTYPFYISGMSSTTTMLQTAFALSATVLTVPKPCLNDYIKLVCQTLFPRCVFPFQTNIYSFPVPATALPSVFPSYPSREVCDATRREECRLSTGIFVNDILAAKQPSLPVGNCAFQFTPQRNCTVNFTQSLYQAAASSGWIIRDRTGNVAVRTIAANNITSGADDTTLATITPPCPAPLVKPNGGGPTIQNGACALPCPPFLRTKDEYLSGNRVLLGFSWVSWVLTTLLLSTFYAFRKTRKKPFPLYFTGCIFLVTTGLCFTVGVSNPKNDFGPYWESACEDNSQINDKGWCIFQAICMLYGGFGAVCWWFIQAIDLYMQIWWNAAKWPKDRQFRVNIAYNLWGWGYPLLNLLIGAGMGVLGNGNNGIPYCLITDSNISWGIFYAPIGVMSCIGAAAMAMIIYAIAKSSMSSGAHKKKGGWLIYIRPVFFVFSFLALWSFVFSYRFSEHFNEDRYKREATAYVQCLFESNSNVYSGQPALNCEALRPQPDLGNWYGILVIIGGVGIWSFLLYNTNENFVMWYHLLTCKSYNFSTTSGPSEESTSRGSKKTASKRNVNSASGSTRNLKSSASGNSIDDAAAGEGTLRYGAPPPVPTESSSADVMMTTPGLDTRS